MWKKIWDEISLIQIIAVSLAAGTAWAVLSKIGLVGSVAGIVIGGIVGSALSIVYKHSIQESKDVIAKRVPSKRIKNNGIVDETVPEEKVVEETTVSQIDTIPEAKKPWALKSSTGIILGALTSFVVTVIAIFFFQLIIISAENSPYRETIIREPGTNSTTIIISPSALPPAEIRIVTVTPSPEPAPTVTITAEPTPVPTIPPEPTATTPPATTPPATTPPAAGTVTSPVTEPNPVP